MRRPSPSRAGVWIAVAALVATACEREERRFREAPPAATAEPPVVMSELRPGTPLPDVDLEAPYDYNAYGIAEGKHLYTFFNCTGCHAHGGGGIGPPLMDEEWIYGSEPENIFATIVEGRPNGMPSFRGRIPDHQVWQLVSYVRSMSGLVPADAQPGRSDHMHVKEPELMEETRRPKKAGATPAPQQE